MKQHPAAIALITLLSVSNVYAEGDPVAGQRLYESRCIGCHSIDNNRVGPAHRSVFGRRAGSVPDYDYSDAVKNAQIAWTAKNLDSWLTSPEAFIPGQKMGYAVTDAKDRADLIAYLMSVSDAKQLSQE